MSAVTVLFVGGPEDGKRVAFTTAPPPSYRVAVIPRLPVYADVDDHREEVNYEQFEYRTQRMPGNTGFVAYPTAWDALPNETGFERVMSALMRGYVGRP